jgi:MOSC domain-containing protein YiiM
MIERSQQIKIRLIEVLEKGEITMGDEIEIIEYMVNRINPISQAEYARRENISRPAAKKRIEAGKEAFIQIGNQKFIV